MSVIIRLQNLPWSANASDIRQFFRGLSIPEGGVHIVGGEHGDAFIAFSSDEDARQAMALSGEKLQDAPVKLLLSSRTEMQRVIDQTRSGAQTTAPAAPATAIPGLGGPSPAVPAPTAPVAAIPGLANPLLPVAGGILPFDPTALFAAFQNPQLAATYTAFLQAAAMAQSAAVLKVDKTAATVTSTSAMSNETLAAFGLSQQKVQPAVPPVFAPAVQSLVQPALQTSAPLTPVYTSASSQDSTIADPTTGLPQKRETEPEIIEVVTPVLPPAPAAPKITDRKPQDSAVAERQPGSDKRSEIRSYGDDRDRSRSSRRSKSPRDNKRGRSKSRSRSRDRDRERRDRRRGRDRSKSRDRRSRSRSRERRYRRSPGRERRRDLDEFGRDRSRSSKESDYKFDGVRGGSPQRPGPVPFRGGMGERSTRPGAPGSQMPSGPQRPMAPGFPQRPSGPGSFRPIGPGAPIRQEAPVRPPSRLPVTNNGPIAPVVQIETALKTPEVESPKKVISEHPQGQIRPLLQGPTSSEPVQARLDEQNNSDRKDQPQHAEEQPTRRDPRKGVNDDREETGRPARKSRFEDATSSPKVEEPVHREEPKRPAPDSSTLAQKHADSRQALLPPPGQTEAAFEQTPNRYIRFYSALPNLTYKGIRAMFRGIVIRGDGIKLLRSLDGTSASIAFIRFENIADKQRALEIQLPQLNFINEASEKEFEQAIDDYQPNRFNREMLFDSCFAIRNIPKTATVEEVRAALFGFEILDVALEAVGDRHPNNQIAYIRFSAFQEAERAADLLGCGLVFREVVLPVILAPIEQYFRAKLLDDTLVKPTVEDKPETIKSELTFVKGLPSSVTDRDVVDFFSDAGVFPVRVHFLLNKSNEPSGDAVIEFKGPSYAEKATAKHRSMMGFNVIEVTLLPKSEAMKLVPHVADTIENVDMEIEDESSPVPRDDLMIDVPNSMHETKQYEENFGESFGDDNYQENGNGEPDQVPFSQFMATPFEGRSILGPRGPPLAGARLRPLLGSFPVRDVRPSFTPRAEPRLNFRPQDIRGPRPVTQQDPRSMDKMSMAQKPPADPFRDPECVLALTNIPFKAGIDEILEFFGEFNLRKDQVLRRYADGYATGDARVSFDSPAEAKRALKLHGRRIWNRIITVSPMTAL